MQSVIAVDFGGSHIKLALLRRGQLQDSITLTNNCDIKDLEHVAQGIRRLQDVSQQYSLALQGLGISFAGIVDPHRGAILSTNGKYQWAVDFNLKDWAKQQFPKLECRLENDARLALLGETFLGIAKTNPGRKNAVLFMLGTGIGTSAIIEGRLLRGVHYQAGILSGHLGADIHGLPCNCGGIGCLEAQVGGWQLANILEQYPNFSASRIQAPYDYKALFAAYQQGDELACHVMQKLMPLWGRGVVNLILAYDPELVICTGGVFHSARHILPFLQSYVEKHAWCHWGKPQLLVVEDVSSSPLLGCEAIFYEE